MGPLRKSVFLATVAVAAMASSIFAQSADLGVTKAGPDTVPAGSDVAYTITVVNNGPDPATNAVVNDPIPAGMTFVSDPQNSGPAFTCTDPGSGNPGTVTCSIATLAAGTTATFTFTFHIPIGTANGTLFLNTVTVSSDTPDDTSENNSAIVGTSTPPNFSNISVTKTGPAAAAPGTDVTFTIVLANTTSTNATSVTLRDTLPGTMTFVSFSPSAACSTPPVGSGGTINCDIGTLAANTSITYTLVGNIPAATSAGTVFSNTAIGSATNDPNPEDDTSTAVVTVSAVDLAVTKSGPAAVISGNPLTYTINETNNGPDAATNAVLTDTLPAGTTFGSLVQNSGPAAACVHPAVGATGFVQCTIDIFGNGASAQFTLTLGVGNVASVSNTATVSTADSFDTNTLNNSSTATTAVSQNADLSINKIAPATVVAGTNITYTINVSNNGPSSAANVSMTDVLPPNMTFVSFTAPAGWTATGGATSTATIPTLASGANATFTLVARVNSGANGSISNTANIASTTADANTGNNSSTGSTLVTASADLALTKVATPNTVIAGGNITYTLNLVNNGTSDATAVSLTDTIPANTTFVSMTQNTGPAFSCSGTTTQTCSIATFISGATASFTLIVTVNSGTPVGTVIVNTASVSSGTPDGSPINNIALATTQVAANVSDLSITKTSSPSGLLLANSDVTFTLTVANGGPNDASSVVVTDTLPATLTFVSATPSQGTCSGTTTVTCSLGTLANAANATVTIVAHSGTTVGASANTATVSSASSDPNPGNNSATVNFTITTNIPTLSPLLLALLAALLAAVALRLLTE